MTVKSNIILRVGSEMGPGGLSSVKAGYDMVKAFAGRVTNAVKELDQFNNVLKTVDMQMVQYADSAAKGQIDTFQLMKSLNQIRHAFSETGVEITSEQFKILAQRATILAQTTGKDTTQAFKELTDSVSKGTTRALKEYGIYISQGTDLAKTHRDILQKLTEGHEDLNVEVSTFSEQMYRVANNWDTFLGLAWSEMAGATSAVGSSVDGLNGLLETLNRWMIQGKTSAEQYALSLEGIADKFLSILGLSDEFEKRMLQATLEDIEREDAKAAVKEQAERKAYLTNRIASLEREQSKGRKKGTGGGARPEGHKQEDILSPEEQEWASVFGRPMESMEDIQAIKEEYQGGLADVIPLFGGKSFFAGSTPTEMITGPFRPGTGPRRSAGDLTIAPEEFAVDVDARLEEMQRLEEERTLEQVALMERLEEYRNQQAEIYDFETGWQAEQLQFAEDYGATWAATMEQVSAGTLAANASINLMRQSWGAVVDLAIYSQKSIGSAMRAITHEIGKALAKEAGWRAAMEYVHAIAAAASYQYGAAAKHLAAGIGYTALAAGGIAVGRATAPQTASVSSSGMGEIGAGPQGGGGYNPSYGGNSVGGNREVTIKILPAEGMFQAIVEENDAYSRAGFPAFKKNEAA